MADVHPTFANIVGQAGAVGFLSRAMAADRLPHGLIFAGPAGVGRRTTAVALAKAFLADAPDDAASLAKTGVLIDARTHPDFHFVTKELVRTMEGKSANKAVEFSVDVIRNEVVAVAGRRGSLGRGRVFVISQAELMNAQAQNALLKTLEEPPGRALIVLLTDQPDALLPTVRSRCQLVRFGPPAEADALAILATLKVEPALARQAVALAGGSPGLAARWAEDGVVLNATRLRRALDGGASATELAALLKELGEAYAERQLARDPKASKDAATRDGVAVYLRIASEDLRRALVASDDPESACDKIESLRRAETLLDGNVNLALVLQQLGLDLAA